MPDRAQAPKISRARAALHDLGAAVVKLFRRVLSLVLSILGQGVSFARLFARRLPIQPIWKVIHFVYKKIIVDFGAAVGVGFLVYSLIYQTRPNISANGSNPDSVFSYPFAVSDNSNIFSLRGVKWSCNVIYAKYSNGLLANGDLFISSVERGDIAPGSVMNFLCKDPTTTDAKVIVMKIRIDLEYYVSVFGLYNWPRHTSNIFIWHTSPNPQWIKGDLAN